MNQWLFMNIKNWNMLCFPIFIFLIKCFVLLPVSKMPLAPYDRTLGGGGGAEGRTVGQTMAGLGWGVGGGGGGGGGGVVDWRVSVLRASPEVFGPGKVESVSGVALMACILLTNHRPADKINSRLRWLIKRTKFTTAEIANAIANPNTKSSSLPLAPKSSAH